MLLMMWVESSRCFPVRMPSAWMIRSVVSWKASRPPSCCIRRTRKLWRVFWGGWVSSMSSRRAWCQSRLNSSCSRASWSVKLNISLRRWTPRTVCTARLGRPLSAQYIGANRSSSIRGSASFRKTSAQLLSRRLAFFGGTRNWDCQRLSCGSRIRNILPSLGQAQRPRPFIGELPERRRERPPPCGLAAWWQSPWRIRRQWRPPVPEPPQADTVNKHPGGPVHQLAAHLIPKGVPRLLGASAC